MSLTFDDVFDKGLIGEDFYHVFLGDSVIHVGWRREQAGQQTAMPLSLVRDQR